MKTETPHPTDKFFKGVDLTLEETQEIVKAALTGADYGELYQQVFETERISKNQGQYTDVSVGNNTSGFGLRVGQKDKVGFSFSAVFNKAALKTAITHAQQILEGTETPAQHPPSGRTTAQLYPDIDPMMGMSIEEKIKKLNEIDTAARTLSPDITNVSLGYNAGTNAVHIITSDGTSLTDERPTANLTVWITLTDAHGKTETGSASIGGRVSCMELFNEAAYKDAINKALHQARELQRAEEAPAGVMDVVLSPGWSAVLLHEAIGHGLEADFNRRGTSVYSGKVGELIASPEVTVIEQGDMPGEKGSLHFDDEGTPTRKNVLIKDGVLMGYINDRQNALLMGEELTGNGRRESYRHAPMPRMTNTYFDNGTHDPEDILRSVKDGIYIADMGGGQVDITSGKFNMNATLAYRIRDGQLCEPLKGVTLVGDGLTVIKSIKMIGNDLKIEKTSGTCGKDGQSVPVGVGQPTILVSNMVVGGSKR